MEKKFKLKWFCLSSHLLYLDDDLHYHVEIDRPSDTPLLAIEEDLLYIVEDRYLILDQGLLFIGSDLPVDHDLGHDPQCDDDDGEVQEAPNKPTLGLHNILLQVYTYVHFYNCSVHRTVVTLPFIQIYLSLVCMHACTMVRYFC